MDRYSSLCRIQIDILSALFVVTRLEGSINALYMSIRRYVRVFNRVLIEWHSIKQIIGM